MSESIKRDQEDVDDEPRCVRINPLVDVVARLRAPDGCAWDRAQTHASLERYLVEETFELVDAIRSGDDDSLCEELGDVLLQVVLHAQIASERGAFSTQDVIDGIAEKMIRRHPHVFGDVVATDASEVRDIWERGKRDEGRGTLEGVPRSMPSLLRAMMVARRLARVGFDWKDAAGALSKVEEELTEVRVALDAGDHAKAGDEIGDLLFAVVCAARHVGVSPELALAETIERVNARFTHVERALNERGTSPDSSNLDEMDALWDAAKAALATGPAGTTSVDDGSPRD